MNKPPSIVFNPASITLLVLSLLVFVVVVQAGGDPLALARIGTRFSLGDVNGSEGYDGQFNYYIALDPNPLSVQSKLDVPAYRYQRILLPMLVRFISLGQPEWIPWIFPLILISSHSIGTWAVGRVLETFKINQWYGLVYGLWAGFILAVRLDLPEPLAYGLVAAAILCDLRGRQSITVFLYALALFAKEVTAVFLVAHAVSAAYQKEYRFSLRLLFLGLLPFLLFQFWLWRVFGAPGLGSGGANATDFEWFPYLGFIKIGFESPLYLGAMFVVFGPTVILPSAWGLWQGLKRWFAGNPELFSWLLLANALMILFIPFSTYRETGGLIRLSTGLVLAVLLYAGRYRHRRVLNYSFFWLVLNVFLLK